MRPSRRIGIVLAAAVVIATVGARSPASISALSGPQAPTPTGSAARVPVPGAVSTARHVTVAAKPTLAQMIGQKLIVRMDGVTPSPALLRRIGRGEIGGVILFGSNITTPSALRQLTATLHAAAAAGGQRPLLIAVDQEGGPIKRIHGHRRRSPCPRWAGPGVRRAPERRVRAPEWPCATSASTSTLPRSPTCQPRHRPSCTRPGGCSRSTPRRRPRWRMRSHPASLSAGVLPTMKHFPGIGFATHNTDTSVVTIGASKAALAAGLMPYQAAIGHDIPLIMLSNATYAAYDGGSAAGWSRAIVATLLRARPGLRRRDDHGLTGRHGSCSRGLDGEPCHPRRAGRNGHDPAHRIGGGDERGVLVAPRRRERRRDLEDRAPSLLRPDRHPQGRAVGDLQGDRAIQPARPVPCSSRALWQVGRIVASRVMAARKWRSNARRGNAAMTDDRTASTRA